MSTKTLVFNEGDVLICDPCYIKKVFISSHPDEHRYDLLDDVTVYACDDGFYDILGEVRGVRVSFGPITVDSGRIKVFTSGLECFIQFDEGIASFQYLSKQDICDDKIDVKAFKFVNMD